MDAGTGESEDARMDWKQQAVPPTQDLMKEIEAMKRKILELEKLSNGTQGDQTPLSDRKSPGATENAEINPGLLAQRKRHKKMERYLYTHRKEWEEKYTEPADWHLGLEADVGLRGHHGDRQHGPWNFDWKVEYFNRRLYQPPDLGNQQITGEDPEDLDAWDEYDHNIDYGGRRERLRRNFEWDMARLWLEEDMDKRRREKLRQKQKEQDKGTTAAGEGAKSRDIPGDTENRSNSEGPQRVTSDSRLNPLDWFSFKSHEKLEEETACVIDILIGEPVIDMSVRNYWYGYSGPAIRKSERPQPTTNIGSRLSGQSPLPERIRIHSAVLVRILAKILGSDGSELDDLVGKPVIFLRPFKVLCHSERALRDWCSALEKRLIKRETEGDRVSQGTQELGVDSGVDNTATQVDAARLTAENKNDNREPARTLKDGKEGERVEVGTGVGGSRATEEAKEEAEEEAKEEAKEEAEEEDGLDPSMKSTMAAEHLRCLLAFMDQQISSKEKYLSSVECRQVQFSDFWHLFRPGMEVIRNDGKQAYRVIHVSSARHRVLAPWERWSRIPDEKDHKVPFSITCIYIDFDGKFLGPVSKTFKFKRFEGEMDVTSLEVYPLRFHPVKRSDFSHVEWDEYSGLPAHERYRYKLIRRGQQFLDVAQVKHMYYAGPTIEARDEVESQVVIDFETAFAVEGKEQQNWKPQLEMLLGNLAPEDNEEEEDVCRASCCRGEHVHDDTYIDQKQRTEYIDSLLPKELAVDEQPSMALLPRLLKEMQMGPGPTATPDELVIMSYRVFGFVLRTRKWAKLDLTYLTGVHANVDEIAQKTPQAHNEDNGKSKLRNQAFDRLVLEDGHRPMIVSLIAQHFRDKKSATGQGEQMDIVKGKGKGLILLLHGAPGVGKTSTAEAAAELFKKPLFQITCGDLGTTASEVEKALEMNFALANRWDCILLLDEADVFLAERTKEDFKRNGLVAVFLRVMEYYAGILFLTTNRVGDFDEAFTSRIHVNLYYPELSEDKTVKVFDLNLEMIEERFRNRGRRIEIEKVNIGRFAARHYVENQHARWNGRQVRNACQTALALAEFEAQGNSHEAILNPDAVVKLRVDHFNIVRNAYLEFAKYINDLHGTNAARRAKEARLRAIWADENDRVASIPGISGPGMDKKIAFRLASQGQQFAPHPQQGYQQQAYRQTTYQGTQQPTQGYYEYSNPTILSPQPGYPDPNQVRMQTGQYPVGQPWGHARTPSQELREGQNQGVHQRSTSGPSAPQLQVQQPDSNWLSQNVQALYAASGPQGAAQLPGNAGPGGDAALQPGTSTSGHPLWQGGNGPQ